MSESPNIPDGAELFKAPSAEGAESELNKRPSITLGKINNAPSPEQVHYYKEWIEDRRIAEVDSILSALVLERTEEESRFGVENAETVRKLDALFTLLLSRWRYDFATANNVNSEGLVGVVDLSLYTVCVNGRDWLLTGEDATLIKKVGVCEDFAKALEIIVQAMGIPCARVGGRTNKVQFGYGGEVEVQHAWNQVIISNQILNYDLTYGFFAADERLKEEKGLTVERRSLDFCLVESDRLQEIGPHHQFQDSQELLRLLENR